MIAKNTHGFGFEQGANVEETPKWYDSWIIEGIVFLFVGVLIIGIIKGLEWVGIDVRNTGPELMAYVRDNPEGIVLSILLLQIFCIIGMLITNNNTEKLLSSSGNDIRLIKMQESISTLAYEVSRLRQEIEQKEPYEPKPIDISNLSQEEQQWMIDNLGKDKG